MFHNVVSGRKYLEEMKNITKNRFAYKPGGSVREHMSCLVIKQCLTELPW